jgi:hypothetical protein
MISVCHYLLSIPVSIALAVVLITMYALYRNGIVAINYQHTFFSELQSFFMHASTGPLLRSLLAVAFMSRLEYDLGSVGFILAFACVLVLCALVEFSFRFSPSVPHTIGISSVFIGLAVVEIITNTNQVDWNAVATIAILVLYPNLLDPCASLAGYATGAVVGVLVGYIFNRQMVAAFKRFRHTNRDQGEAGGTHIRLHNPLDNKNTAYMKTQLFRHK